MGKGFLRNWVSIIAAISLVAALAPGATAEPATDGAPARESLGSGNLGRPGDGTQQAASDHESRDARCEIIVLASPRLAEIGKTDHYRSDGLTTRDAGPLSGSRDVSCNPATSGTERDSGVSADDEEAAPCVEVPDVDDKCEAWVATYDDPDSTGDRPLGGIAVSPQGDRIYQTGTSWTHPCEFDPERSRCGDIVTVAYDADGQQLWKGHYAGATNNHEQGEDVAVSPDGARVYVSGLQDWDFDNDGGFAVIAYDAASGSEVWTARYDDDAGGVAGAWSVAVSPDGEEVYAAGVTAVQGFDVRSQMDYATVAFDADTGAQLWDARYDGPGAVRESIPVSTDFVYQMEVSPDGSQVYVTGESTGSTQAPGDRGAMQDYATVAYRAAPAEEPGDPEPGTELWVARYDASDVDAPWGGMAVSPDGSRVVVTGYTSPPDDRRLKWATVAYDAATGAEVWVRRHGEPGKHSTAEDLAFSPKGDRVVVVGMVQVDQPAAGRDENDRFGVVAYDAVTGTALWDDTYGLHDPPPDAGQRLRAGATARAAAVAVSGDGETVYVGGDSTVVTPVGTDLNTAVTVAYDATDGTRQWIARFDSPSFVFFGHMDTSEKLVVSEDGKRLYLSAATVGDDVRTSYGLLAYDTGETEPSPTPSPTGSQSPSPTPDPSPTEGGSRGTYPMTPNDPYFGEDPTDPTDPDPTQWALRKIQAPQAWQQLRATGFGIRVAVIDTGVDLGHEDLSCPGKLDILADADLIGDGDGPDDADGHGTHVAGIIGACTDNGKGIAGVAPDVTIMPLQVFDAEGNGNLNDAAAAVTLAADSGAHVINLSLGSILGPASGLRNPVKALTIMDDAIADARAKGVVVVAAAGNDSGPICEYPAAVEGVLCVGATDPRDLKSWYSTFPNRQDADGPAGAVVAPGGTGQVFCDVHSEEILSLYPNELDRCKEGLAGYRDLNGTSMASPHVAGVAALVYDRLGGDRSEEAAAQVIAAIIESADDLGVPGYDPVFGSGRVNALSAVQAVEVEPDPDPTPTPTPSETTSPSPSPTESGSPSPSPSESPQPGLTEVAFTANSATAGQHSDKALFEARLTDSDGAPLEGRELSFELAGNGSRTFTATTNDDGVAAVTPTLEEKPGPHQLTVRFAGDEEHAGDADTTSFVVEKEDSALDLSETKGKDKALVAHLYDVDTPADGIAGRTIDFYDGAELIGSATTDDDGVATFQPPKEKGKKKAYQARFDGDNFYVESSDVSGGKGNGGNGGGGSGGGNGGRGASTGYGGKVLLM